MSVRVGALHGARAWWLVGCICSAASCSGAVTGERGDERLIARRGAVTDPDEVRGLPSEAAARPSGRDSAVAAGSLDSGASSEDSAAEDDQADGRSDEVGELPTSPPAQTDPLGGPDAEFLQAPTGPCPEFRSGRASFMPDGRQRDVELALSDRASDVDGALVFTWFATSGTPSQAFGWIGSQVLAEIAAEGGIVVAPYADQPASTRPWYNTPGGPGEGDRDLRLMDEVLACAQDSVGVDVRRIHAIGMSAGGLQATQVAFRRSGYIASVAIYSGGFPDDAIPPDQNPDNRFASMVLYGGPSDISPVDGIPYLDASNRLADVLRAEERFVLLCDHGGGHTVPPDAQQSVWRFFVDHPYGTIPSPYERGVPDGFVTYCD
jgi:predicted esterase